MSNIKKVNSDPKTVLGFGQEWTQFNQSELSIKDAAYLYENYFSIFPWHLLKDDAVGFDLGCGSGRWSKFVAPKVGILHCIDPSDSIEVAKENLKDEVNCIFHKCGVDDMPIDDSSMDFGYSLGVLHHIPDTFAALATCVSKLKPGAPFLLYLYYNFDNRPAWYKFIWLLSELPRRVISRLPFRLKYIFSQLIALFIYLPFAKCALIFESFGFRVNNFPLNSYRHTSFYVMRTDALDRFGTILEHRFSRDDISEMMQNAGLRDVVFSEKIPYWCALGYARI
jgi:SAM-dependent methyltransferase